MRPGLGHCLWLLLLCTAGQEAKRVFNNVTQPVRHESSKEEENPSPLMPLSDESRLVRFLTKRYRRAGRVARPVLNSTQTIRVEFAIALIQILDFDETNQVLSTNVWKRYRWLDELLTWDPADFGGIADIRMPADLIWVPDIVLYNNADVQEKTHEELVAVYNNGLVRWIPPAIYKSSCQLDMRNFPFDEQTCHFKFGSWTYDGNKLDLCFYDDLHDLDIREYIGSSEWDILATAGEYHARYYPCCGDEHYPDLTFTLTIKRRTAFYIFVLILPSVILSFLTLVLFWIPPQRPDRTSLGMSLFSSFFVLLLILVQSSPPTSASISLLGVYYCINMVLIAFSTMLSALVINLTHYLRRKPPHRIIRLIFIEGLGRVLCVKGDDHIKGEFHSIEEEAATSIFSDVNSKQNGNGSMHKRLPGAPSSDRMQQRRQAEWRTLASVLDRLFFIVYVVGIILTMIFVFPR